MKVLKTGLVTAVLVAGIIMARNVSPAFARIVPGGVLDDEQASIIYSSATGELAIDAPANRQFTSINIDSRARIFTGDPARNLGGSFDNDSDVNIFKATFGGGFQSLSFGNVAQSGLDEAFLLDDMSVVGSLYSGGDLGAVDLIYFGGAKRFNVSFSQNADVNTLDIDFGDVQTYGDVKPMSIELTNLVGIDGINSTANLDLVKIRTVGDVAILSTDLAPFGNLEPGQTRSFTASFDTHRPGQYF